MDRFVTNLLQISVFLSYVRNVSINVPDLNKGGSKNNYIQTTHKCMLNSSHEQRDGYICNKTLHLYQYNGYLRSYELWKILDICLILLYQVL